MVQRATGTGRLARRSRRSEATIRTAVARGLWRVYLLASRQVWAPRSGSAECTGLAYPPADQAAFEEFAGAVMRSERIAALLAPNEE